MKTHIELENEAKVFVRDYVLSGDEVVQYSLQIQVLHDAVVKALLALTIQLQQERINGVREIQPTDEAIASLADENGWED